MMYLACPCKFQVYDFAAFRSKILFSVDFPQWHRFWEFLDQLQAGYYARYVREIVIGEKICDHTCVSCHTTGQKKAVVALCVCISKTHVFFIVFPMNGTFSNESADKAN